MNQLEKDKLDIFEYQQEKLAHCLLLPKRWILPMMSPCILVIHDDVKLLIKLEAALNKAGYRVLTGHDVVQGMHLAQAADPEVILYDVNDSNVGRTIAQGSDASIPFIPLAKRTDPQELVCRVNAMIRSHAFR